MNAIGRAMLLAVLLSGPLTQASCATAPKFAAPQGPTWTDVSGVSRDPLKTSDHVATVLLFIAPDCPISNSFAREITRIAAAYEPKGVAIYAIHSDPRITADVARKHASDYGYDFPVLLDPAQRLAKRVRATVTPEAAVLDRAGNVVYLGRIDDTFYSFGHRRETPTTHELRDALDAVMEGRPVSLAAAPPIGCEIPPPLTTNANSMR
jgi:thiol-disulfide isomerase/thioredoxin